MIKGTSPPKTQFIQQSEEKKIRVRGFKIPRWFYIEGRKRVLFSAHPYDPTHDVFSHLSRTNTNEATVCKRRSRALDGTVEYLILLIVAEYTDSLGTVSNQQAVFTAAMKGGKRFFRNTKDKILSFKFLFWSRLRVWTKRVLRWPVVPWKQNLLCCTFDLNFLYLWNKTVVRGPLRHRIQTNRSLNLLTRYSSAAGFSLPSRWEMSFK